MNTFKTGMKNLGKGINMYSPQILTGFGISGFLVAIGLAVDATLKAKDKIDGINTLYAEDEITEEEAKKEKTKTIVKAAIAPTLAATGGVLCVIAGQRKEHKRTIAATAAMGMYRDALHEYKEAVIEKIGERKEQTIRDEIDKKHVEKDQPKDEEIILAGGDQLCYDKVIGRYFKSNIDTIRKAETTVNRRLLSEMYISLNEFYDEMDLPHIDIGDDLGWNIDDAIELTFSSQLTEDKTPVLVISYEYCPRYDFRTCY